MANTNLPLTDTVRKNPKVLSQIRQALGILYDEDGKLIKGNESEAKSLLEQVHSLGIPEDYTIKDIGIVVEKWFELLQQGTETTTEIPKYKAESNTLTPDQLAQFQEEDRIRKESKQKSDAESKEDVARAIKRKQEIYAKVKVDQPKLPEQQQKEVDEVINQIKEAPIDEIDNVVETIKQEIKSRVPEDIPDEDVELTAGLIVANVKTNFVPSIQAATTTEVADKPKYVDLAELLSDQSKTSQELKDLTTKAQNVAKLAFGEPFQETVLPSVAVEDVSDVPTAGFIPIQIPVIYQEETKTGDVEVVTFGKSWVQDQLSQNSIVQGVNYDPKRLQSSFSAFKPLTGIAKDAAVKAVKKVATKAITKAAGAEVGAEIGAAVGVAGGPLAIVTSAVGAVIGWLADKVNWKEVRRWSAAITGTIAGLIALPFVGLGYAVGIGLGTTGIAMGLGAGLGGITLGGIGGGIVGFFGAVAGATIGAIAAPILWVLLGIPVTVAFILFIINSGAYVVPPNLNNASTLVGERDCAKGAKIVERAKAINNKLQLGFNHYYNKSPDYSKLWNATLFAQNPNPPIQTAAIGSEDMFWCNYMATESYKAINETIPFPLSYMVKYFQDNKKWVSGDTATLKDICPGDTIFFSSPPNSPVLAHVAVVGSVTEDEITTIQSNSPWKTNNYAVNGSGHFPIYGTIKIVGFGAP